MENDINTDEAVIKAMVEDPKIRDWFKNSSNKTNIIVSGDISPESELGKAILDSASTKIIIPEINVKESVELDLRTCLQIGEGNHLWRSEPEIDEVVMIGDCKADEKPEIVRDIVRRITPEEFQEKVKEYYPTYTVFGAWEIKTSPAANQDETELIEKFFVNRGY